MSSHVLASSRLQRWRSSDTLLIVVVWAFVAALLAIKQVPLLLVNGPTDPDSQMRLVEVRDYLAGAAWTDLRQLRLDPPDGLLMHWSRLIDWPLAGIIRLARPLVGREAAELLAITVWPLLLYLVFFFATAAIARRLAGAGSLIPALAFAAFAAPATGMFVPGHITHHNAQIALVMMLLALAVRIDRGETIGVLAGIVASVSLAIGLETLPLVGMTALGLALTWAFAPSSTRAGLNGFGLFFAAGMVVQRAFTATPADWLTLQCDIASAPYVAVAVIGGVGIAALAMLKPPTIALRFLGLGGLGLVAAAAVALINPLCLKGPYAEIDPRIVPLWLDHVEEARSFGVLATGAPWMLVGLYLAPFLALIPTSWAFANAARRERAGWGLTLLLLMTAIAVSMWEARGSTFASALAVPGIAYAVGEIRRWATTRGPLTLTLALLLVYTVPNQAAETIAASLLQPRAAALAPQSPASRPLAASGAADAVPATRDAFALCAARDAFAGLSVQPAGTVLIESNLGPAVLLDTHHATIAAPYHRNARGLVDGFTALEGSMEAAEAIVIGRHVAYVATCPADPEVALIRETAPEGFLAQLLDGHTPAWLQPIEAAGPLKLWRVVAPVPPVPADPVTTGSIAPRDHAALPGLRGSLLP